MMSIKVTTDIYSHCVVHLISPFAIFVLIYHYIHSDTLTEVIHNKPCEDFLHNSRFFLCVEVYKTDSVFEFSETCFDTPTKQFELRKDDRDYRVGDWILLKEFENGSYTGRECGCFGITYILRNCPEYGLADGYCIIGW